MSKTAICSYGRDGLPTVYVGDIIGNIPDVYQTPYNTDAASCSSYDLRLSDIWGAMTMAEKIEEESKEKEEDQRSLMVRALKGIDVERILVSPNKKATIVFWGDGSKTVVKLADGDEFDLYAGFTAAVAKKLYGSNSALKKMINRKVEYQKWKK